MKTFYPDIEPFNSEHLEMESLKNGEKHRVYIEQCGNPKGIPILFLHGGPGSGCRPQHRCYFDPNEYHIILFDQRGCGRSLPIGELENNTSNYLVADMEVIRQYLNIEQWLLFGGSWGATLALLYAQTHPDKVSAMILRGTFLGRQQDIDWVYAPNGAAKLFPDAWQRLVDYLPQNEDGSILERYYRHLTDDDKQVQVDAAKSLQAWESTVVTLRDHEYEYDTSREVGEIAHSQIQLHFALKQCFIPDNSILDNIDSIRHIPCKIIHGRYDIVCPAEQSWQLQQQWPEASLHIVPLAGHAAGEAPLVDALVQATQDIIEQLK